MPPKRTERFLGVVGCLLHSRHGKVLEREEPLLEQRAVCGEAQCSGGFSGVPRGEARGGPGVCVLAGRFPVGGV